MKPNHNPTLTASKIALIYALVSVVWILFSDQLLAATVTSVETMTAIQMAKGWAFVLATSVLIFFLMRQEMRRFFEADEAQRASEFNFKLLVENSRDFILFIRREDGRILEANTAASAAYGYSRDELLKLRVQDLREPNTIGLVPDQMAKADAEGILFETIHQRKDGTTFPVEVSSKGATVNGMRTLISVGRDITERKRSEAELRRLATAIEQAAEMVIITDKRAEIVYANPAFEKITGYSQMEVLGKNPQILKSGEHDHEFYQDMWALLSAGETWRGRFVNKKKNGSLFTEEATISPVLDPSGNIINYVAVKRDITKEQELEQQYLEAQKMEAIGSLAGGIAHDFNNILAIILANAQILEFSGAIGSESKETLNQIIIASKRARELVRQILAISRRGKQEKIIMNLKPIVKETIGLLRASLPATIRLEPHIAADTGMLFADPTQMQQVLMNLCTNAAHAMEKEGGVLKVTLSNTSIGDNDTPLEPGSPPGEYVKLTVSDTGHGMQPWILKRIFEPYFTTKETGKGTGLGLSVAHGIVKSHGGAVKVSSVVRKGSVFEIYLPRVKGEASETDKFDMPLLTGTGRILFVDDEPALTLMGQKILGRLGYRVHTTNSSVEALEIFRSKPNEFDLVITDLTMPGLTGINLAKALLTIRPELPIVLCTGFSDRVNEEMLKSMGIRGLMLKPLTIHELAHSVRMAIEVKP
jgi:PAS domain S-box-containing protein